MLLYNISKNTTAEPGPPPVLYVHVHVGQEANGHRSSHGLCVIDLSNKDDHFHIYSQIDFQ